MNVYRQMLLQVVRDRCGGRMMMRLTGLILACIGLLLALRWVFGPKPVVEYLPAWLVCFIIFMWCGAFLKSAIQQNLPSNACLVPGLRHRLMTLTAVVFAICMAACAALIGATMGHAGYALVAAGAFGVYLLFAQRYTPVGFLPSVVIIGSTMLENRPYYMVMNSAVYLGEPVFTGVGMIVVALLFALGLRAAFLQGGDRHWAWVKRFQYQQARLQGRLTGSLSSGLRWLAWTRLPYRRALQRDVRPGTPQGRLMMHALGTAAYDGPALLFLASYTVLTSAAGYYFGRTLGADAAAGISTMMQSGMMLGCLGYTTQVAGTIVRHADEQRLYSLTPAAPAREAINRVLFNTLLFRFLRLWLAALAGALCFGVATTGVDGFRGLTWMFAALVLPFGGVMLRYYAWLPKRSNDMMAALLIIFCMLVYIALIMADRAYLGLPWFGAGCVIAGLSALGLALRWRRLVSAPPMLPAGRLLA